MHVFLYFKQNDIYEYIIKRLLAVTLIKYGMPFSIPGKTTQTNVTTNIHLNINIYMENKSYVILYLLYPTS